MDLGLADRVYIVTGASRGLGYATAQALVADGARVLLSARDADGVAEAAASLGAPDQVLGVVADNADPVSASRLIGAARDSFGRIDGLLVSVGGPPGGTVAGITDEQWVSAFESVFLGAVRLARAVASELETSGSIAFVLSSSVRSPIAGLAVSNGLRPGLAMVAKTMADELGPRGIRVNGLLPGRIETARTRELDAGLPDPAAARQEREERIPLRRYGGPEEFGRVAAFLLSPAASYVSGAMWAVDGGELRAI
jgi:3-oxoacyl-[acyl-carrier protein] reductase